jgi:hypothetical protein
MNGASPGVCRPRPAGSSRQDPEPEERQPVPFGRDAVGEGELSSPSRTSSRPPLLDRRGVRVERAPGEPINDGRIAPLATRGIVGQVTPDSVVYDTGTTRGGSGGPVIDNDGRMIAVNSAITPDFAGANLGVPASEGLRLVESAEP